MPATNILLGKSNKVSSTMIIVIVIVIVVVNGGDSQGC